jgi:hypothetical protein
MKYADTLFEAEPENACRAYINLRNADDDERALAARDRCDRLWRDFAPFADRHFLTEFPARLHERWFEMYLTVALLQAGLDVQCPKPGPDVLLTVDQRRIWIEAVCASAGVPGALDSVPEPDYATLREKPVVTELPRDQMVLRIRNSLAAKDVKFQEYIESGIVGAEDICVTAINVHAIPRAWPDMRDLMMTALYGVGNLVVTLDRETGDIVSTHHEQITSISKQASGAAVGVQPFTDGSMSHISAVIGSNTDAGNLSGRFGDDFGVYPNVTSTVPWIAGAIPLGEEMIFREIEDAWRGEWVDRTA